MIKIYKDNDTKVVTKGAYDNFYKPLGYNIVIEEKPEPTKVKDKPSIFTINNNDETVTENKRGNFKKNKKED